MTRSTAISESPRLQNVRWDEQKASGAREFFFSPTGRDFLAEHSNSRPNISGTTIEEKAMSASIVQGYELAQRELQVLINFTNQTAQDRPRFIPNEI